MQCTFRLVSQFSLTLSLDHLFIDMYDATKSDQVDKVKENSKISLKVHCASMQLSLSYISV